MSFLGISFALFSCLVILTSLPEILFGVAGIARGEPFEPQRFVIPAFAVATLVSSIGLIQRRIWALWLFASFVVLYAVLAVIPSAQFIAQATSIQGGGHNYGGLVLLFLVPLVLMFDLGLLLTLAALVYIARAPKIRAEFS